MKAAGYRAARATSGADFTSGGYSSVNPDNRFSLGTAVITRAATLDQFERYLTNPMIEVEDIYGVINDTGPLGSIIKAGPRSVRAHPGIAAKISRTGTDFAKDSYGSIYMPDAGDEVSIPLVIFRSGTYALKFRVKTGYRGSDFASSAGYEYRLDGGSPLRFSPEGPVVNEDQNITWGYHRLGTLELQAGVRRISIRSLQDWAVLVDGLVLEYLGK